MVLQQRCKGKRNVLLFTFAFIIISLSSGLIYGYPHLRKNLIENGTSLTESQLGIAYTAGSWSTQGGRFFFGLARDKYGTRSIAFLAILCALSGSVGIALSNRNSLISLAISCFFVGLGSGGQLCLQPVASLFHKKWQGTILASLSGAFQISGLVFFVLTSLTQDRIKSFGGFAIFLLALAICSLFLLPKNQFLKFGNDDNHHELVDIEKEERKEVLVQQSTTVTGISVLNENESSIQDNNVNTEEQRSDLENDQMITRDDLPSNKLEESALFSDLIDEYNTKNGVPPTGENINVNKSEADDDVDIPVTDIIKSREYVLLIIWFSIQLIPAQYYIGTIGFQLELKGDNDGKYLNLFSILYACAAFFSPVLGKVSDIFGLGVTQSIATILLSSSLCILASNQFSLNVHAFGMTMYGIGRMALFGMFFTNVGKRLGYKHYGTLAGLGLLISALVSLIQYPLIDAAARGYEYYVNIICGSVMIVTGIPYCIWLFMREKKEGH